MNAAFWTTTRDESRARQSGLEGQRRLGLPRRRPLARRARSRWSRCRPMRRRLRRSWRDLPCCAARRWAPRCIGAPKQFAARRSTVLDGGVGLLRHRPRRRRRTLPRDGVQCGPFAGFRPALSRTRGERSRGARFACFIPAGACERWPRARRASIRCRITTARSGRTTPPSARRIGALRRARRRGAAVAGAVRGGRHFDMRLPELFCGFPRDAASRRSPIRSPACRKPGRRARRS